MIIEIINKILIMLLFMSIINVVRHVFYISLLLIKNEGKYILKNEELRLLAISIAYILMTIVNGVKI